MTANGMYDECCEGDLSLQWYVPFEERVEMMYFWSNSHSKCFFTILHNAFKDILNKHKKIGME